MITPPRNILCSYHYFKTYDLDRLDRLRIIGDSGAFSARSQGAEIKTSDIATWARHWKHRLAWVAALDVIGDTKASRRNWAEMVNDHQVQGVPTIHFGEHPSEMDWYVEQGVDFMGLGGLVAIPLQRQMRWLIQVFKYAQANHPQVRFHGWGITSDRALHLPFYSVDSSGWTSAMRYGRMTLRDPRPLKPDYPILFNGRDVYAPPVAKLLQEVYRYKPAEVAYSSAANRQKITRLTALSTAVAEERFRRRHGTITAPVWGLNPGSEAGPHSHLATAVIPNADPINIQRLNEDTPGPHMHLADTSVEYFRELNEIAPGPHLHLADIVPEDFDEVNKLTAE